MTTVRELLTDAHLEIGVLAEGEQMNAAQAAFALRRLNRMIGKWQAERLQLSTITRTVVNLVNGQQVYSLSGAEASPTGTQDGFDTKWALVPEDWTRATSGTGSILNDVSFFQAGGHSVKLNTGATPGGTAQIYRDFVALAGHRNNLSLWASSGPNAGAVYVQNLTTGNYAVFDANDYVVWQATAAPLFDNTFSAFVFAQLETEFFTETDPIPGTTVTLRITLTTASASANDPVWFDTFDFQSYADIHQPRPVYIDHVNFILSTGPTPVEIPLTALTDDAWELLSVKSLESTQPTSYWWNPTVPGGTLSVWPIPNASGLQIAVYYPTQLTGYTGLTTELVLPPGYEEMIVTNLAFNLCPSYSLQPSPALAKAASDSMATVKRANYKLSDLAMPAGAQIGYGGGYWDTARFRSGP